MNYSTIHELPVITPSFSVAVLAETETTPNVYQTGQINLYSAVGVALDEALSSGYLNELRTKKIYTAFGDSDTWTKVTTQFIQTSSTFVTKDYVQANYLSLTGGEVKTGVVQFNNLKVKNIYTENGTGSNLWDSTATQVLEFSSIKVLEYSQDLVFTDLHHGRAHHFNTPADGSLTLTIPLSVNDGFNAVIMNTGNGVLIIDSPVLRSTGSQIETRYSGAFIYKDNSSVYAVGNIT